MSDFEVLKAKSRQPAASKGELNAMRAEGLIPGVIFGKAIDSIPVQVGRMAFYRCLAAQGRLMELDVEGKKHLVNVDTVQTEPVNHDLLHLSFYKVKRGQETTLTIPVVLEGDAAGVKEGGVLVQQLNEIDVTGKPKDIPEALHVNVEALGINENISLKDVKVPAGITFNEDDLERTIATCNPPVEEVVAEPEETPTEETETKAEGAEGAEGSEETKPEEE